MNKNSILITILFLTIGIVIPQIIAIILGITWLIGPINAWYISKDTKTENAVKVHKINMIFLKTIYNYLPTFN